MNALHELVLTLKNKCYLYVQFVITLKKILVQIHVERDICIFLNTHVLKKPKIITKSATCTLSV